MIVRESKTPDWEISRAILNHDWLKNRFVLRTNALVARLQDASESHQPVQEYLDEVLPQWPAKRDELADLLARFEPEMSPRRIVERWLTRIEPSECYIWLAEAVHLLWLRRCGAAEMKVDAEGALARVERAYQAVSRWLDPAERGGDDIVSRLRQEVHLFARLRDAGGELSEVLSMFPHEVRVL
jgi:hypothetical protein